MLRNNFFNIFNIYTLKSTFMSSFSLFDVVFAWSLLYSILMIWYYMFVTYILCDKLILRCTETIFLVCYVSSFQTICHSFVYLFYFWTNFYILATFSKYSESKFYYPPLIDICAICVRMHVCMYACMHIFVFCRDVDRLSFKRGVYIFYGIFLTPVCTCTWVTTLRELKNSPHCALLG